jgi:transposase-like protein
VARPAYEQLVREIEALGYLGVGRRYGVSDNAIRKWRRSYEAALATEPTAGTVLDASAADGPPEEARREVTPGAAR